MSVPPTIHNTLGVLFIVVVVGAALYGAGMLQGWFYFRKYNASDHWYIRALVAFVLFCDTIQFALITAAVYQYAVTMHDDPLAMTRMEKTIMVELYFGGALAFAVQGFYCWRIHNLSKNFIISGVGWLLALASMLLIFVYTALTIGYASLGDLIQQEKFATALNSVNAVGDVYITLAMIYSLSKCKTGFRKTTDVINRLIIFTFNTGIPTSLLAILDVVFLNTMPSTFLYMGMYLTMDRFYTNCLLVTLNSRRYIRYFASDSEATHESIVLSSTGRMPHGAYSLGGHHKPQEAISIQIDKTTHRDESGGDKDSGYTGYKTADAI